MRFQNITLSTIFIFLLLISLNTLNIKPTFAQSFSEVYIDVEPPNYSLIKNPGTSEKLYNNVRSNQKQIQVQGFDWNKRSKNLEFTYSKWFSPSRKLLNLTSPTPASFSYRLNIPQDTQTGEYYKMMTYSNKPFSCEESDNPAVMVGVPINTLVVSGVDLTDKLPLDQLKKIFSSQLRVTGFKNFFSLLNQSQNFDFTVTNIGNIQAFFYGYLLVKNQAGEIVEKLDFDYGVYPLEKDNNQQITLSFKHSKQLVGRYKAELYLGYQDALAMQEPVHIDTIEFTFVGAYIAVDFIKAYGIFVLIFLLLRQGISVLIKKKVKLQYLTYYLLVLALVPAFFYSLQEFIKSQDVQGTITTGGDTVSVSAIVRESSALKVVSGNGIKIAKIVSQNSRTGWELWSFNCGETRLLSTDQDFSNQVVKEIVLDEKASKRPLLLISRFFKPATKL